MKAKHSGICGICGGKVRALTAIYYQDAAHGMPEVRHVHNACWRAHILKHYPGCRLALWLAEHPDAYTTEDEQEVGYHLL